MSAPEPSAANPHGVNVGVGEHGFTFAPRSGDEKARIDWLAARAARELEDALGKFDSFNSPHEGLAVIWEEFEELKAHVWANTARYSDAMDEAVQVAAMALRFVHDLAEWGPGYVGK